MWQFIKNAYLKYFAASESGFTLFLLLACALAFYYLGGYLLPIFIAVFLSFLLNEAVIWLRRRAKLPHLASVALVFVVFFGTSLTIVFVMLPALIQRLRQLIVAVPGMIDNLTKWLYLLPERYPEFISKVDVDGGINLARENINAYGQQILSSSLSSLGNLVSFVVYCALVMIMVFFMLKDYDKWASYLAKFLPKEHQMMDRLGKKMKAEIFNYIRGKFIEMLIVAGVTWIVFAVLGLNFAFLLALMVGVSVIIPYVGAFAATIPVAIVAVSQFGFENYFFYVLLAYLIIQVLDGNLLVPYLFSEIVNIHPVSIIVAIIVFGSLWGFWGVFLAIPIATFIKALVQYWPRAAK